MIDCHAHAFPAPGEQLDRALDFLPADASFLVRDAIEDVRGAVGSAAAVLGRLTSPLRAVRPDIETVASAGRRVPTPIWSAVEKVASLGTIPRVALRGSLDALLTSMDRAGVERTVLIAAPPLATNAWVLEEAWPRARERIIPVVMLPELPHDAPEADWVDALTRLAEQGARGFKLHSNMDGLSAEHPAYRAAFQVAQDQKRFIILHTGCFHAVTFRKAGPVELASFESLFREFADVPVCLAHMNRERPEEAWELMRRFEQLYADTSWQPLANVQRALEEVGPRRLLLGSDWPLLHGDVQEDALGILRRAASEADLERITRYTPRIFLGEA